MPRYDLLCSGKVEERFLNHYRDLLKKPKANWYFDSTELNAIAVIFLKFLQASDRGIKDDLPIEIFDDVLNFSFGFADSSLVQRIFAGLEVTSRVNLEQWIDTLSLFLRGTLEEQIKYCYRVYDTRHNGHIRRDQMLHLTRHFFDGDLNSSELVKDYVETVMRKVDVDMDASISFDDFRKTVLQFPLMLQCLGQCLPDDGYVVAFLATFTDKFSSNTFLKAVKRTVRFTKLTVKGG